MCSDTGFNSLTENEMFNIRGGAETDKPKTRPKEIIDWDIHSQLISEQSTSEHGLIDYLKQRLKNWKK